MEYFEKEFYNIAKSIIFHEPGKNYGEFQNTLKKGVNLIKETKKIIIAADKSNNYYSCDLETFKTLRSKNMETDYKKSNEKAVQLVDKKSCEFAESMKLEEKAQKHTKSECFLTLSGLGSGITL